MRGEDAYTTVTYYDKERITPACAGKTAESVLKMVYKRDHPRMRGEDLGIPADSRVGTRITPACAGKTTRYAHLKKFMTDHPRMRGEDSPYCRFGREESGSPPHARGRPLERTSK